MSRAEAVKRGFIKATDAKVFERMDAWPDATLEIETLESAAQHADPEERARFAQMIAQREIGTGTDVNSLAWQELLKLARSW